MTKIDPQINDLKGKLLAVLNLPKNKEIDIDKIISAEILYLFYVFDIDKDKKITFIKPNNVVSNYKDFVFCLGNVKIQKD